MTKRYLVFDVLKSVGIFILIICHQIAWLFIDGDVAGFRYVGSQKTFNVIVKIVFYSGLPFWGFFLPFLAGASTFFYIKKETTTAKSILIRTMGLTILGFVLNFFAWGINDLFAWDVLPFIATCILVSWLFIKNFEYPGVRISLFLLGLFSLYLSNQFPFAHLGDLYIYKIILGDSEGYNYWPFFPWFSIFAAGIFVGYYYERGNKTFLSLLPWLGGLCLGISYFKKALLPVVNLEKIWGPVVFKPSPYYVLAVIGFSFLAVGILQLALKKDFIKQRIQKSYWVTYGQGILWVYIFSTIIGYRAILAIAFFCDNLFQALFVLPLIIIINLMLSYFIAKQTTSKDLIEYK